MDLICTPMGKLNMMVVMYFVMFGLGGFLSFPVVDKIGRYKSHLIFSTGHLLAQAMIIFIPSYTVRLFGFCLMGFMCSKNSLCITWLFEFMVKKDKSIANTSLNSFDNATGLFGGLYFLFISKHWFPLAIFFFILGTVAYLVLIFFCPESPKWLLLQDRRKDAIKALNFIAAVNRSPNRISPDTKFPEAFIAGNLENNETYDVN